MAGRLGMGFPKPGAVFSWMAQQCDARADASRGAASRLIRRVDAGSVSGGKLAKKGQPNACDKAALRDHLRSDGGLRLLLPSRSLSEAVNKWNRGALL